MAEPLETQDTQPRRRISYPALPFSNIKLRESVNNCWRAVIPRNTPIERLFDSDFWVVRSADFMPFDTIACVDDGRNYYVILLVLDCGRGYCNVLELSRTMLPTTLAVAGTTLPPNHEITHNGPVDLYVIKRISDGVILGKNFESHAKALEYLLSHASLR